MTTPSMGYDKMLKASKVKGMALLFRVACLVYMDKV